MLRDGLKERDLISVASVSGVPQEIKFHRPKQAWDSGHTIDGSVDSHLKRKGCLSPEIPAIAIVGDQHIPGRIGEPDWQFTIGGNIPKGARNPDQIGWRDIPHIGAIDQNLHTVQEQGRINDSAGIGALKAEAMISRIDRQINQSQAT